MSAGPVASIQPVACSSARVEAASARPVAATSALPDPAMSAASDAIPAMKPRAASPPSRMILRPNRSLA